MTAAPSLERTWRVDLALAVVAVLFSLNYILGKIALREFHPFAFAWLRVAGSAILLQIIQRFVREDASYLFTRADRLHIVVYSLLGVVFNQLLFIRGLSLTSAHTAAILITTIPIFTLAAALVLRKEEATMARIGGITCAAAGAVSILGFEATGGHGSILGDALILTNCLSYGLYLVLSKTMMFRVRPIRFVSWIFGAGALLMFPFTASALATQDWGAVTPRGWLALAVVIAGPTVVAYVLNAWALARADSSTVAAYTYLQPFVASVLAALILHETIQPTLFFGAILIFAGVYLASRRGREESVAAIPPS